MERIFNIGKIADFFQIPTATLRYWEEVGLIKPAKNKENDYREYSIDDLMTISDILFYKNLGLPLKQIKSMERTDVSDHKQLLESKRADLVNQRAEIDKRIQRLQHHLSAIDTLHEFEENPFQLTDIDTEYILPFELIEIDKLKQYIENPYLYSRVQHSDKISEERRGLAILRNQGCLIPEGQILWKKTGTQYVACLLKEEITDGFPNNLPQLLKKVQSEYHTGYIISRFLLCAQEGGKLYDFYKTYIEIEK